MALGIVHFLDIFQSFQHRPVAFIRGQSFLSCHGDSSWPYVILKMFWLSLFFTLYSQLYFIAAMGWVAANVSSSDRHALTLLV